MAVSDDNVISLNRDPQRPRPLVVQLQLLAQGGKVDPLVPRLRLGTPSLL